MSEPVIEVLSLEGCPHAQPALELVERVVDELGVEANVRRFDVFDLEAATSHRFLGSPTIRVNGRDVEPGAEQRSGFALSCRVYRTERGFAGQPEERWLREALLTGA
jgi:hypothetical protein